MTEERREKMNPDMRLDLAAEAHFLSCFDSDIQSLSHFFLETKGTKERGRNREVLSQPRRSNVVDSEFISLHGMEVSRNGLYDLLPESLFHALVLGRNSSNTYEVIDEIRQNRIREREDRLFFMPFDTELFLARADLLRAELDMAGRKESLVHTFLMELGLEQNRIVQKIQFEVAGLLLQGQEAKDKHGLLEHLLSKALDSEVCIQSICPSVNGYPTQALGTMRLSVDSVLDGPLQLEDEDWMVQISSGDADLLSQASTDKSLEAEIHELIDFFAYGSRCIHIHWIPKTEAISHTLGQGRLGVNLANKH